MCFNAPAPPAPPPPPPPPPPAPTPADPQAQAARRDEMRRSSSARGLASAVKTSQQGVLEPATTTATKTLLGS